MTNTTYFQNLDGLRFLSFLVVFISHLGPDIVHGSSSDFAFLNFIFQHGRTAVSFFFVLSGFLITYFLIKEKIETSKLDLKAFYVKRIFRILPLYFIVCLIGFIVVPMILGKHPSENVWSHLFFGANFDQIYLHSNHIQNSGVLAPLWSIAVEEQFYLFWPFLLLLVNPKKYMFLFVVIMFGSYSFIYLNRFNYSVLMLHTFSVIHEFMIGAVIAFLTYHNFKLIQWIKIIPKWLIGLTYILVFGIVFFIPSPYHYIAYPYLFAFIILEQVFSENSLFKVSSIKGLDYLGKISYGCYMYHSVVSFFLLYFYKEFNLLELSPIISRILFVFFSLSITIGVSYLSYNYFESYFLSLRKRILRK